MSTTFRRAASLAILGALIGALMIPVLASRSSASSHAGQVFVLGAAPPYGGAPGHPVTGMARTHSRSGYWLASATGGVTTHGDANFHGSLAGQRLNAPIVDMAAHPRSSGYWLVGSDGGVFAFGGARFHGSAGNVQLREPVVGMTASPSGNGYWLVASDGGVFTYGDAPFLGSTGHLDLRRPIVAMMPTSTGRGYWLVAADGGVFTFGDAPFHGSAGNLDLRQPVVDAVETPTDGGYWLLTSDGGVLTFGDAPFHGSASGRSVAPAAAIEATGDGKGLWLATGGHFLGDFETTCYSLRGTTASGEPVSERVVAVDPDLIRLHTPLFVGTIGARVALDTGANIQGRRLDIWHPSTSWCRQFGRQVLPLYLPS